jgi:uncharacterized linocin/CFP29 family protein
MRPFRDRNGDSCIVVNGKKQKINVNATLPYDAWKDIDRRVVMASEDRLTGVNDLINKGLTHDLGSLGVTLSQWDKQSSMTAADVSMNGETAGDEDRLTYTTAAVPVPIFHKDFRISMRAQQASERTGEALDTQTAFVAAQKVAEASEDMIFNGVSGIQLNTDTISGYTNFSSRNTFTIGTAWDLLTDNDDIVDDVVAMMDLARGDGFYGPYCLYIPDEYEGIMDKTLDASSGNPETVRDRLLRIPMVEAVKVVDRLADNNVVLVQLTPNVVDLAIAQNIAAVEWTNNAGFTGNHRVFAAWAVRVKDDADGNCGIVHGSV